MHCRLNYTCIKLQSLQDIQLILILENTFRGGISSVMRDRYVKSNRNKKILYEEANILYGWAMSQSLPYDEFIFDENVNLGDIINTPHDSDIDYFIECD